MGSPGTHSQNNYDFQTICLIIWCSFVEIIEYSEINFHIMRMVHNSLRSHIDNYLLQKSDHYWSFACIEKCILFQIPISTTKQWVGHPNRSLRTILRFFRLQNEKKRHFKEVKLFSIDSKCQTIFQVKKSSPPPSGTPTLWWWKFLVKFFKVTIVGQDVHPPVCCLKLNIIIRVGAVINHDGVQAFA